MEHLRTERNFYYPIRAELHFQTDGIFIFKIMELIRIKSGCDGHLIGVFDNYTIEDHKTKYGIKCKLYEIPIGNNSFDGYNDFHYDIEKVFKCDGCGQYKPTKEKFKVYDENYNLQKGVYECAKCKGL